VTTRALLVDLYELTMAQAYLRDGVAGTGASFSLFVRGPLHPSRGYLVAAGLAVSGRPPRFRFQRDGAGALHLMQDGHSVGTLRRQSHDLPLHLTALADLRVQPLALAHLLMAVPDEVIDRAGVLVARMLREAGR